MNMHPKPGLSPAQRQQLLRFCLPGAWQQQQHRALAGAGIEQVGDLPELVMTVLEQAHLAQQHAAACLLQRLSEGWWRLAFEAGPASGGTLALSALAPWQISVHAAALHYRLALHPQPLRLVGLSQQP